MLVDGRVGSFGEYRNYSDVPYRESIGRILYISRLCRQLERSVINIMNESLYADNSYSLGGRKILSMMVDRGFEQAISSRLDL
jgi:hypothetical protein